MKALHIRDPKDLLSCTEEGCTYQTFVLANMDRHIRSNAHWYNQDRAIKWEKLCYEIATVILNNQKWQWKPIISTSEIQERQYIIPDIVIYKEQEIDFIIDAKMSIFALHEKDFEIYPQIAKKVIFWVLNGESQTKKYNNFLLEFVSAEDLKKKLLSFITDVNSSNSSHIKNLLVEIDQCKNIRINNSSTNGTKGTNSRLDTFV